MSQIIYLYYKNIDYDTLIAFLNGFEDLYVKKLSENLFMITDESAYEDRDYNHLREMAMQEFYQDFTAFIVPKSQGFDANIILQVLPKMNPGVYEIQTIIPEIVLSHLNETKSLLKNYYYSLCGIETIESVIGFIESNLNASEASKRLFMHRNTLNYRLDHFVKQSRIDIRTFEGALAIYLLFRI
ncbi:MAG: helix-turn-helix domain-containing protein [Firmicutes bacterium]|nr:helix-turn-helix domain-containing protein [Bacillota bacterium]